MNPNQVNEAMKKHEELPVIADSLRIQYRHLIQMIPNGPKLYVMCKAHYQERGDKVGYAEGGSQGEHIYVG